MGKYIKSIFYSTLVFSFLLLSTKSNSQVQRPATFPTVSTVGWYKLGGTLDTMKMFIQTDSFPSKYPTIIFHNNGKFYFSVGNGANWREIITNVSDSGRYVKYTDTATFLARKTDTSKTRSDSLTLRNRIESVNSSVYSSLASEANTRYNADSVLQLNISNEAITARAAEALRLRYGRESIYNKKQ